MNYTQQVIVPAYVWNDPAQRKAVATVTLATLTDTVTAAGRTIIGDIIDDAHLDVDHLQAQVGHHDGTDFVAYQPCEPTDADLIFIRVTVDTQPADL